MGAWIETLESILSVIFSFLSPAKVGGLIGVWCNGSTEDFGSSNSGSNPDIPTNDLIRMI